MEHPPSKRLIAAILGQRCCSVRTLDFVSHVDSVVANDIARLIVAWDYSRRIPSSRVVIRLTVFNTDASTLIINRQPQDMRA